jgi:F-type H+-transporting ATPase subunit epsilon
MAEKLRLEIYTPEGLALNQEVDEIEGPGFNGAFGLLPQHTPYFVLLKTGVLSYRSGNEWKGLVVDSGYAVVEDNIVKVVVNSVEAVDNINYDEELRSKEKISEEMKVLSTDSQEFLNLEIAYRKTIARIQAYERFQKR